MAKPPRPDLRVTVPELELPDELAAQLGLLARRSAPPQPAPRWSARSLRLAAGTAGFVVVGVGGAFAAGGLLDRDQTPPAGPVVPSGERPVEEAPGYDGPVDGTAPGSGAPPESPAPARSPGSGPADRPDNRPDRPAGPDGPGLGTSPTEGAGSPSDGSQPGAPGRSEDAPGQTGTAPGQGPRPDRGPSGERPDRPDRPDRPEQPDRPRLDQADRSDLTEQPDRPDRPEQPEQSERPAPPERPDPQTSVHGPKGGAKGTRG